MFPSPQDTEITPAKLQALRSDESAPKFLLIDCREEDEFAICRIEGAQLVPLSRFGDLGPSAIPDSDTPTVVYCHHGMRSLHATHFLREKGFDKVWSLAGGIDLWSTQIEPEVPRY